MKRISVQAGCAVTLMCVALVTSNAHAYPAFDDGAGNGCVQCHDDFGNGNGPLHNAHKNTFDIGVSGCDLCHPSGPGSTPVLTYSSGLGLGCAGCHGRDYGETSPNSLAPKASAYGLRQFHASNSVPGCPGCHVAGSLGHTNPLPAIFPESVAPPYYGLPVHNLTNPCDSAQEDMAYDDPDDVGLDNDGDGAADYPADADCAPPPTTTTTLPPGSGDFGITGKKLIIVDKLTAATKAKVVYVAKDSPAGKGTTNDPAQISATFDYESPTLGAAGGVSMPQGDGWLVNKEKVAKYVNKDAPGGAGAVKVAVIKPGKLLKAVVKDLGDAGNKIDIYGAGDPAPGSVDVNTQYTVVDGLATRRHCGEFTGCARKIIGGGTGAKVVCKTATAGASVTCPSSPSGAFLE